jgi:2-hydroxy-3-oxopropionate reductase
LDRAGIPTEAMLGVPDDGSGHNFATTHLFPSVAPRGTFDFGATIEVRMKDLDLAIAQGEELGAPM